MALPTVYFRSDEQALDDTACRYCASTKKESDCGCYDELKVWWEACELAALVLPSSGTAERVFSFAKNLFSDYQNGLLTDALSSSLYFLLSIRELLVTLRVRGIAEI